MANINKNKRNKTKLKVPPISDTPSVSLSLKDQKFCDFSSWGHLRVQLG